MPAARWWSCEFSKNSEGDRRQVRRRAEPATSPDHVATEGSDSVRYEPEDNCPPLLLLGVGVQGVMLILASIVLIVAIAAQAGGQDDSYIS